MRCQVITWTNVDPDDRYHNNASLGHNELKAGARPIKNHNEAKPGDLLDETLDELGWGSLSQFLPFHYYPSFLELSKHRLLIEYHFHIWQMSLQLSCRDTCPIWMWSNGCNMHICEIKNMPFREINEKSFSGPHPWLIWLKQFVDHIQGNQERCGSDYVKITSRNYLNQCQL